MASSSEGELRMVPLSITYDGFADIYRKECESKPNNEIDKELHAELVKLDTRLELKTITI